MNVSRWLSWLTLATIGTGTIFLGSGQRAIAQSPFDQTEISPSTEIVLFASPIGSSNRYQLIILEQLTTARECWQDNGGIIDPLLLDFDFTGICRRNNDSNGYSLRMAQEDLGIHYSLRVISRNDHLELVATHRSDPAAQNPVVIGRSPQGLTSGFVRIDLYPNWRLTRRSYQGSTLGHFYLTHDVEVSTYLAMSGSQTTPSTPPPSLFEPSTSDPSTPSTVPSVIPDPEPLPEPDAPTQIPDVLNPGLTDEITLPSEDSTPLTQEPDSQTTDPVPQTIQVPTPPPVINPPPSPQNQDSIILDFEAENSSQNQTIIPPTPLSTTSTAPPQPPSDLASALGFSYRVVVPVSNPQTQAELRRAVPDAFPVYIDGQVMMQMGLFEELDSADEFKMQLRSQGFRDADVQPVD